MVYCPTATAAYAAANNCSTATSNCPSIVEKSIDIFINIPKQFGIWKAYDRKLVVTKMYMIGEPPKTEDFIRWVKKEYGQKINEEVDFLLESIAKENDVPKDVIGYSVTFNEPVQFYTK